jgi:hypothetical protein
LWKAPPRRKNLNEELRKGKEGSMGSGKGKDRRPRTSQYKTYRGQRWQVQELTGHTNTDGVGSERPGPKTLQITEELCLFME